jgi:hypothetical protein
MYIEYLNTELGTNFRLICVCVRCGESEQLLMNYLRWTLSTLYKYDLMLIEGATPISKCQSVVTTADVFAFAN